MPPPSYKTYIWIRPYRFIILTVDSTRLLKGLSQQFWTYASTFVRMDFQCQEEYPFPVWKILTWSVFLKNCNVYPMICTIRHWYGLFWSARSNILILTVVSTRPLKKQYPTRIILTLPREAAKKFVISGFPYHMSATLTTPVKSYSSLLWL